MTVINKTTGRISGCKNCLPCWAGHTLRFFIDWQGGSETIRQNGAFKDFFELGEFETTKEKYLDLVGTEIPLRFFKGGRSLDSILSRQPALLADLKAKYGDLLQTVGQYYDLKKHEVSVHDISPHLGRDA